MTERAMQKDKLYAKIGELTLQFATLEHDLQSVALSLLLVFAGSVLHSSLGYGLIFVAYSATTTLALGYMGVNITNYVKTFQIIYGCGIQCIWH